MHGALGNWQNQRKHLFQTPMPAIFDLQNNVAPVALHEQLWALFAQAHWRYGSHTDPQSPGMPFWHMDLTGQAPADALWQLRKSACEARVGHGLRVVRQYANGHTYRPHVDDQREGCYTLLYYPMLTWSHDWDGETVFFNPEGEILQSVQPRPNRAVLFDSRIIHAGRGPSRSCPMLRVTMAYKLERD
jgi:SM-20-related protein